MNTYSVVLADGLDLTKYGQARNKNVYKNYLRIYVYLLSSVMQSGRTHVKSRAHPNIYGKVANG